MSEWRVIDGRPAPAMPAPYIYLVLRRAGQHASAIYRGDDPVAVRILNAHGGHTQRQLYNATPAQRAAWGIEGQPNKPGFSPHELRSDGVSNPHVPPGLPIKDWQVGIDSGSDTQHDKDAVVRAAAHFGWHVHHPYASAVEGHHWSFVTQPHPHSLAMRARIIQVRATLPRH